MSRICPTWQPARPDLPPGSGFAMISSPFTFPLELSHLLSDFSVLVALRPSWSCRGPFTVHLFPRAFPTRSRRPVAALLSVRIHSLVAAARPDPRSLCVLFLSSSAARSHGETQRGTRSVARCQAKPPSVSALVDVAMRPDPRSLCVLLLSSSAARSHGETQCGTRSVARCQAKPPPRLRVGRRRDAG